MSNLRTILLGAFVTASVVVPAFAQMEGPKMKEKTVTMVMTDGRMVTVPMTDSTMTEAFMKSGKPISSTSMMMMSGGKVYTMDDQKMPDGTMMSEHLMKK